MYHAAAALLFKFIFPPKLPQGEMEPLFAPPGQAWPQPSHVYFAMLRLLYLWTGLIDYYVFLVMEGQPGKSQ